VGGVSRGCPGSRSRRATDLKELRRELMSKVEKVDLPVLFGPSIK
jgi:hypothetical protein